MGENTMAPYKTQSYRRLRQFINIFKSLNRRGILGILILVVSTGTALAAPLLTSLDPVEDQFVAGDYAYPYWYGYLFPNTPTSENFNMLSEEGFPDSAALDIWNFTATSSSASVTMEYDAFEGNKRPGCALIRFSREQVRSTGKVSKAMFTKEFRYPYKAPPTRFASKLSFFIEGAESLGQIELVHYIHRVEENGSETQYLLWYKSNTVSTDRWQTKSLDSYGEELKTLFGTIENPAAIIFSKPGNYKYTIEIRFDDSKKTKTLGPAEASVFLDDLNVKFLGNSFGLLGTDHIGRDILSQIIYGARISLLVGLLSAVLSVAIGLMVGLIAGYLGFFVDEIAMRVTDMLLVLPTLPLLIVLIAVLGPSIWNIILLISFLGWMGFARLVRSQVLSLKERPFIEAAKAVGAGKFYIIGRHILPNVMSLVYVSLALSVPSAILAEAALSWLGLFDPTLMTWGRMLFDAQNNNGIKLWWWMLPPGLAIAALSISFILLGYALDEILNPKLRVRR